MTNSSPTNNSANRRSPLAVALAILYREEKFLLQLRDDIPTILYPGQWTLFGGHLEPGEEPEAGIEREIWEEITFRLTAYQYFDCYADDLAIRHVFHAPLTVPLEQLTLQEGWDFALVSVAEITQGHIYSAIAQQTRPIGDRHQRILLDFLKAELK